MSGQEGGEDNPILRAFAPRAPPEYRNYRSNALNELNIQYNQFQNKIKQLAYAHTDEYYKVREQLFNNLVENEVVRIHALVFNALVNGRSSSGNRLLVNLDELAGAGSIFTGGFVPRLSEKEANNIAMSITKGFLSAIETEIVDYIMPPELFEKSLMRSANVNRSARS